MCSGTTVRVFTLLFTLMVATGFAQETKHPHPLDPLNWQEYWTVLEVLQGAGHVDGETRFSLIHLNEPDKNKVIQWSKGEKGPRAAYAVVRQGSKSFKAVVDLVESRLVTWQQLEGVQPSWLLEEFTAVTDVVKKHPDFIKALAKRGIKDMTFVDMYAVPPGYFGLEEEKGKRVAHCNCIDLRRRRNHWPSGIAGLTIVVDMDAKEVIRVVDEGVVPFGRHIRRLRPSLYRGPTRSSGTT